MASSQRAKSVAALVVVAVCIALAIGGFALFSKWRHQPAPWSSSCTVASGSTTVKLDSAQLHNASIIVGVAQRQGLPTRASEIAIATALQESDLRNIDYGDRDSLGLFQQRPSQGWGTADQIKDPYYSSAAFYAALVKVKGWKTADIGDVAQSVQKSGHPDAYDKQVAKGSAVAQALTGDSPRAITCSLQDLPSDKADSFASFASKTLPARDAVSRSGSTFTIDAATDADAQSVAATAIANAGTYGVRSVSVGDRSWSNSWPMGSSWERMNDIGSRRVIVTLK